jgi:hypothetical protein
MVFWLPSPAPVGLGGGLPAENIDVLFPATTLNLLEFIGKSALMPYFASMFIGFLA